MNTNANFFQFPICLLAYGPDPTYRLRAIVSYCSVGVGKAFIQKHEDDGADALVQSFDDASFPQGTDMENENHRELVTGMHVLKVRQGDARYLLREARNAEQFIVDFTRRNGPPPLVRIKTNYLWDVLNQRGLNYLEFATLCSVYSWIGRKRCPVRITYDMVAARILGYSKPDLLRGNGVAALLIARQDKAEPLERHRIRYLLDKLEERGFYARCHFSPRKTYFGLGITAEELRKQLRLQCLKPSRLAANRAADRELQHQIRAARKAGGTDS